MIMNFEQDVAAMGSKFIKWRFLALIPQSIDFQLVGFCIGQGIALPFLIGNYINFGLVQIYCNLIVYKFDEPE